jgi:hypothetical protein
MTADRISFWKVFVGIFRIRWKFPVCSLTWPMPVRIGPGSFFSKPLTLPCMDTHTHTHTHAHAHTHRKHHLLKVHATPF